MSFDKSKEYTNDIKPLVNDLRKKCVTKGIPFFFSACIKDDGKATTYKNESYTPEASKKKLTENRFDEFYKVTLGFKTELDRPTYDFIDDIIEDNKEI
jgi:hypothetical protein